MTSFRLVCGLFAYLIGFSVYAAPKVMNETALPNYGRSAYTPFYSVNGGRSTLLPHARFFNLSDDTSSEPKLFIAIPFGGKFKIVDTEVNASADTVSAGSSRCAFLDSRNWVKEGQSVHIFVTELVSTGARSGRIDYYVLTFTSRSLQASFEGKVCKAADQSQSAKISDIVPEAKPLLSQNADF